MRGRAVGGRGTPRCPAPVTLLWSSTDPQVQWSRFQGGDHRVFPRLGAVLCTDTPVPRSLAQARAATLSCRLSAPASSSSPLPTLARGPFEVQVTSCPSFGHSPQRFPISPGIRSRVLHARPVHVLGPQPRGLALCALLLGAHSPHHACHLSFKPPLLRCTLHMVSAMSFDKRIRFCVTTPNDTRTSCPQTCCLLVHGPWSTAGPGSPLPLRLVRRSALHVIRTPQHGGGVCRCRPLARHREIVNAPTSRALGVCSFSWLSSIPSCERTALCLSTRFSRGDAWEWNWSC